ncbi:hypothetical protein DEU38_12644 [Rhodococcus sp. AG1013]|uniref:hypothetical protein n=1 Tax=Rhodococcus sp. AG1013 TaxID=2183996 RepID=UPI000E2DC7C9|nr:hypothetical protein [Rhodococcus sp. AG1013]RDI16452.1 hypothetical protein DEU38_12644 [Rhodococcus sp. AG1013]
MTAGLAVSSGDRGGTTYHLAPDLVDGAVRAVPKVEILELAVSMGLKQHQVKYALGKLIDSGAE